MTIVLAGATGALGGRIAGALRDRDAAVTALVRPGTAPDRLAGLTACGVRIVEADSLDESALTDACRGADCVVSALSGLRDTIVGAQGRLLDAAVHGGVKRFIPSDFAADFTGWRRAATAISTSDASSTTASRRPRSGRPRY